MKHLSRRGFLRTGVAGAAGLALAPSLGAAPSTVADKEIIRRKLGKTGIEVPVVSFGVMRADNANLCKAAYENGIRLFDTANGYQNGNNETMLGNLLKDYPRDSFYLATKVKPAGADRDGKPTKETTTDDFLEKFSSSLARLKMDYVDILYVHDVSTLEMMESKPILNAVSKLKKEGKARFIGFSTHRNEPLVIDAAASSGNWDVILTSYNFQQAYRKELDAAISKAADAGIGIVAMKTLAGGGFLDKERSKPINTTAAIKWALSNLNVHTTIPGMTTFDQLNLNLKILSDISLTEQERNDIFLASASQGLFCSGCSECLSSCPRNVPVPDLMRAYMYAYGYASPAMARTLLDELGIDSDPCSSCSSCSVKCSRGFDIRGKVADISRLRDVPAEFLA
ncbi:MAG: aldo/keto reductase [Bacteroidales bacterium]|jgi:predicted aldo/keto reductase-like oxidoreductase|nr:aldo/keto reductase [Bacteroidales bacterium]